MYMCVTERRKAEETGEEANVKYLRKEKEKGQAGKAMYLY